MLIAILDLRTTSADRPAVRLQLDAERPQVRTLPGCVDMRVFDAPDDPERLTVLHEWDDEAAFAAYLASDMFARSGEVIRPLLTDAPVSRRFRAELVETVR
ncbi:MAG TPA: antibiotic biosynthesis monooxygenase [Microthrixaceae bacterium]|nr:antibiotic biosynthesis monooxygenase [Microthrixaceae bacterium]